MTIHAQLKRPIVLTFVRHYLPGYKGGGPVRSIANIVDQFGDQYEFRIVTSDRDYTESQPYPDILKGTWNSVGKAQVFYLAPKQRSWLGIRRLLRETPHDILYLNSFFDFEFTIRPLLIRKSGQAPDSTVILAPRGELSEGRLRLKAWKKMPFLAFARTIGLYRDLIWHASDDRDKVEISSALGAAAESIYVASNLPGPVSSSSTHELSRPIASEPLRICFLSRISPEKNLDFALDVLRRVEVPVRFDIYGPIRDDKAYWARCQQLMAGLPPSATATYRGSVMPQDVGRVMAEHDLFFLPTRGENFGHVVLESLSAGTPVLIADTTPWRDLEASGVGWDLPLSSPDAFARKIEEMAAMTPDQRVQMRNRVLSFAERWRSNDDLVEATRNLFERALGVRL